MAEQSPPPAGETPDTTQKPVTSHRGSDAFEALSEAEKEVVRNYKFDSFKPFGVSRHASRRNDREAMADLCGPLPDEFLQANYIARLFAEYGASAIRSLTAPSYEWDNKGHADAHLFLVAYAVNEIQAEIPFRQALDPVLLKLVDESEPGSRFDASCAHEAAIEFGLDVHQEVWDLIKPHHIMTLGGPEDLELTAEMVAPVAKKLRLYVGTKRWQDGTAMSMACKIEA